MNKVIKYASVYISCEKESLSFYTDALKFQFSEHVKVNEEEEWWVLRKNKFETVGLILIKNKTKPLFKSTLIINADDCIMEYVNLKNSGMTSLSEPVYSPLGLSINFLDPSGNNMMLLEERKYSEFEI